MSVTIQAEMRDPERAERALLDVTREFARTTNLHDAFHSAHEGYAVLAEEVDELWDEVKRRDKDVPAMRREAVQVAAMALRFIMDVCKDAGL